MMLQSPTAAAVQRESIWKSFRLEIKTKKKELRRRQHLNKTDAATARAPSSLVR